MPFGESFSVVGSIGPSPGIALSINARHAVYIAGVHGTAKSIVEILAMFYTEAGFQSKSSDRFHLNVGVSKYTP